MDFRSYPDAQRPWQTLSSILARREAQQENISKEAQQQILRCWAHEADRAYRPWVASQEGRLVGWCQSCGSPVYHCNSRRYMGHGCKVLCADGQVRISNLRCWACWC